MRSHWKPEGWWAKRTKGHLALRIFCTPTQPGPNWSTHSPMTDRMLWVTARSELALFIWNSRDRPDLGYKQKVLVKLVSLMLKKHHFHSELRVTWCAHVFEIGSTKNGCKHKIFLLPSLHSTHWCCPDPETCPSHSQVSRIHSLLTQMVWCHILGNKRLQSPWAESRLGNAACYFPL